MYRDLVKYLREHNIAGVSKGYLQRYERAIQNLDIIMIRKYFLSCKRFLQVYQIDGVTVENAKEMYEYKKKDGDLDQNNLFKTSRSCIDGCR